MINHISTLTAQLQAMQQENATLRAEGRVLREGLAKVAPYLVVHGWEADDFWPESPLIAAEAERVRKLEAVANIAEAISDVLPATMRANVSGHMKVWVVVNDVDTLRAALAALEGE